MLFLLRVRVLFISWESPLLEFVMDNFDGGVRDGKGGAGFVIRDPDARLLAMDDFTCMSRLS